MGFPALELGGGSQFLGIVGVLFREVGTKNITQMSCNWAPLKSLRIHASAEQRNMQGHLFWSRLSLCLWNKTTKRKNLESASWPRDLERGEVPASPSAVPALATPCNSPRDPCSPHPAAHCSESRLLHSRSRPLCHRSKSWGCTSRLGRQSNWLDIWVPSHLVWKENVHKHGGTGPCCLVGPQREHLAGETVRCPHLGPEPRLHSPLLAPLLSPGQLRSSE